MTWTATGALLDGVEDEETGDPSGVDGVAGVAAKGLLRAVGESLHLSWSAAPTPAQAESGLLLALQPPLQPPLLPRNHCFGPGLPDTRSEGRAEGVLSPPSSSE